MVIVNAVRLRLVPQEPKIGLNICNVQLDSALINIFLICRKRCIAYIKACFQVFIITYIPTLLYTVYVPNVSIRIEFNKHCKFSLNIANILVEKKY